MTRLMNNRRYVVQGAIFLGTIGVAGMGVAWSLPPAPGTPGTAPGVTPGTTSGVSTSPTQGEPETLEPAVYLGVQRLRRELCLTRRDLASMGCDTATATTLLERLISVHSARRAEVIAARNAVLSTKSALYGAQRTGEDGPDNVSFQDLAEDYHDAVEAYHDLLESIAGTMDDGLTADQTALWSSALASQRDGRPPELRFAVEMTAGQLEDALNPGDDLQGQPLSPIEAADLRLSQEASIALAQENRATYAGAVLLAEEAALPVPPELIEDPAGIIDDEVEE